MRGTRIVRPPTRAGSPCDGAPMWVAVTYIPDVGFIIGLVPPALLALLEGGPRLMAIVIVAYSVMAVKDDDRAGTANASTPLCVPATSARRASR